MQIGYLEKILGGEMIIHRIDEASVRKTLEFVARGEDYDFLVSLGKKAENVERYKLIK